MPDFAQIELALVQCHTHIVLARMERVHKNALGLLKLRGCVVFQLVGGLRARVLRVSDPLPQSLGVAPDRVLASLCARLDFRLVSLHRFRSV